MSKTTGNKQSQMTTNQLVTMVILVISFVIILFLWYQFNFASNITKETCHTSIILRATASLRQLEFRNTIPLKCKTDKICLTSSVFSSGCSSLGSGYRKITVASKDDVLNALANNLYEWHTTLGEGKINFMELAFTQKKYCLTGSIISFDKDVQKIVEDAGGITKGDLFWKLSEKKTDQGTSYLQEMYKSYGTSKFISSITQTQFNPKSIITPIDVTQNQAVIGSIVEDGKVTSLLYGSGAAAVGLLIAPEITVPVLLITSAIGGGVYFYTKPDPDAAFSYSPPDLVAYNSTSLKALDCSSFETLS